MCNTDLPAFESHDFRRLLLSRKAFEHPITMLLSAVSEASTNLLDRLIPSQKVPGHEIVYQFPFHQHG